MRALNRAGSIDLDQGADSGANCDQHAYTREISIDGYAPNQTFG
jgi:hypothetical protein